MDEITINITEDVDDISLTVVDGGFESPGGGGGTELSIVGGFIRGTINGQEVEWPFNPVS